MARGKTKSKLTLRQRREESFKLFAKGWSDVDVAKKLKVSRETASNYRKRYEAQLSEAAKGNPQFLRDVLTNTHRALSELDMIRADAWDRLDAKRSEYLDIECPECGETHRLKVQLPVSDQARVQYQNVLLKAQDQRAKILNVLGVKQEFFIHVQNVNIVQAEILKWLQQNLPADLRESLADFISGDLAPYMDSLDMPVIETTAIEAGAA